MSLQDVLDYLWINADFNSEYDSAVQLVEGLMEGGCRMKHASDALTRKQEALAERIASALADSAYSPRQWELYFNSALKEIKQFDREFEVAK